MPGGARRNRSSPARLACRSIHAAQLPAGISLFSIHQHDNLVRRGRRYCNAIRRRNEPGFRRRLTLVLLVWKAGQARARAVGHWDEKPAPGHRRWRRDAGRRRIRALPCLRVAPQHCAALRQGASIDIAALSGAAEMTRPQRLLRFRVRDAHACQSVACCAHIHVAAGHGRRAHASVARAEIRLPHGL